MANIENRLLSKLIDEGNTAVLNKFNITTADFTLQKDTYLFIRRYIKEFGQAPAYTEVVAECPSFEYMPEIPDNVAYMCKKLKSDNAKRRSFELLQKEATERFSTMNGSEFISWLHEETSKIKEVTSSEVFAGTNFATNGAERKQWYMESKEHLRTPILSVMK